MSRNKLVLVGFTSSYCQNNEKNPQNIFIASHRGMLGSAICLLLESRGFENLIRRTSKELNLRTYIIHAARAHRVTKLMFLDNSCVYPKMAKQPFGNYLTLPS